MSRAQQSSMLVNRSEASSERLELLSLQSCGSLKLKGGGKPYLPKFPKTDNQELQKLLTLTRSLEVWKRLEHQKCPLTDIKKMCSFCLTRSLMVKLNMSKGRKALIPTEVSRILPGGVDMRTMLSNLITEISKSYPDVSDTILTNLHCTECSEEIVPGARNNSFVDLKTHKQNEDLTILVNKLEMDVRTSHRENCDGEILDLNQNILFISSDTGMRLRLSKPINFFGKSLRCKAVITETGQYFSSYDLWYQVCNETITNLQDEIVSDVLMVTFEADSEIFYSNEESIIYQGLDYQKIIQIGDRHRDSKDRHLDSEARRMDRHSDSEARRMDRHLDSEARRMDRHLNKTFRGKSQTWDKLKKDIDDDTGMDVVCCSCLEMKSKRSCVCASNLSPKLVTKYCYKKEISRSLDGKFYVCLTCQLSIKADKEPTRALKELFGFLDFPQGK